MRPADLVTQAPRKRRAEDSAPGPGGASKRASDGKAALKAAARLHAVDHVPAHVVHAAPPPPPPSPPVAPAPARPRRVLEAIFSPVLTLFGGVGAGGDGGPGPGGGPALPPAVAHAGDARAHAAAHHRPCGEGEAAAGSTASVAGTTDGESETCVDERALLACQAAERHTASLPSAESAPAPRGALPASAPPPPADDDDCDFIEFDPYAFIKALPPLVACVPPGHAAHGLLPRRTRACAPATLVLDLDETLVHSTLGPCPLPGGADFSFDVSLGGRSHPVHVRTRPHLLPFLERVASLFEVVVFTASQKVYAEQLLNIVDPGRRFIRHRVYRDSCVVVEGNYLKDLTVLGRDLARTVIVDNSPQAFGFQLDNGVPIESWYDDERDDELARLLPLLEALAGADDVRPLLASAFGLRRLVDRAPSLPPAF